MSVRAWVDVGRKGTLREALGRARAARSMVGGEADVVLSFTEVTDGGALLGWHDPKDALRRETGGPPWLLGPGALLGRIALAHGSVLTATPRDKILNRNVRPLLAALRKRGIAAMYGGRDFVGADGEIVALLGWARGLPGEVVIDVAVGDVLDPRGPPEVDRAHLGKRARVIATEQLGAAIAGAYAPGAHTIDLEASTLPGRDPVPEATARIEVAIGRLSVHRTPERVAIRGDFFADDALEALELALPSVASDRQQLEALMAASGVTMEGVADWPTAVAGLIAR